MDNSVSIPTIYATKNRDILEKITRVAVHSSDLDGIASAAILLLLRPSIKIDFLSVTDAKNAIPVYDLVVDLPKIGNAINIDHHQTNFRQLKSQDKISDKDLIDPKSPSATVLLAKYFGVDINPHVKKIVEMANMADTGRYNEILYIIDKIIKCNSRNPEALLRIAWALARHADKILEDEWVRKEYERLLPVIETCVKVARRIVSEFLFEKKIEHIIVIVEDGVPRICLGDIMYNFIKEGGKVIVLINIMREKDSYCPSLADSIKKPHARISIRAAIDGFDAGKFLESFGGGGHRVAAGAKIGLDDLSRFIFEVVNKLQNIADFIGFVRVNSGFVANVE